MIINSLAINLALSLIRRFEGCSLVPYLDIRNVPTIGWGNTFLLNGQRVTINTPAITQDEANQLLAGTASKFVQGIEKILTWQTTTTQTAAIISLGYNIGLGSLSNSTLIKDVNEGKISEASLQFPLWCHCNGRFDQGLYNRRLVEQRVFNQVA